MQKLNCPTTIKLWERSLKSDYWSRMCLEKMKFDPGAVCLIVPAKAKKLPTEGEAAASSSAAGAATAATSATASSGRKEYHASQQPLMVFPMEVTNGASNVFKTIHGGMLTSLVDITTSLHLTHYFRPEPVGHVSVSISTQFMKAASCETKIHAVTRLDKVGKSTAFMSVKFVDAEDHTIIYATGTHVEAIKRRLDF